jgi:isoquinoline 1-oxidoreductase subunit alpha
MRLPAPLAKNPANSRSTSEEHTVSTYAFTLNGKEVTVDAPADMSLLWVLRDLLGVTGPKYGCGVGVCRACTCHVNGQAVQVCTLTAADVVGKKVTTIEGLANGSSLHPVQQAWIDEDVAQCGFCQPGQIMQAAALLKSKRNPSDSDIDQIMNVCRCGTYCRIRKAIKRAASTM